MKKQILNIGNALSRAEQKRIQGGSCSIYVVDTGWISGYSWEEASWWYDGGHDDYVSNYCCGANCGTHTSSHA